jgi:hypothetical protein
VLQRVPADHHVGGQVTVLLGVQVLHQRDAGLVLQAVVPGAGVDADAPVVAQPADQLEERSLPAADLEDGLAPDVVGVDPPLGQLLGEHVEPGRERLALLVARRVGVERHVEHRVGDEAARRAERDPQRALGEPEGLLLRVEHEHAVARHAVLAVEHP